MFGIVGLGNPGSRYADTRHNVGFWVADRLMRQFVGPSARWEKKLDCEYLRLSIAARDVLLIKPQKYMNLSGEAALPLLRYFRVERSNLLVVYDELDLEPGVIRIRDGGSAGGHRGVEDIVRHLGSEKFGRIRIGIGHPTRGRNALTPDQVAAGPTSSGRAVTGQIPVADWVLSRPRGAELELINQSVEAAAEAVEVVLDKGIDVAQQRFNRKQSAETKT